jgi:hypothetical protein
VGDLVDAGPSRPIGRLPGGGRLLAVGGRGAWLVDADGTRRGIGDYDDAAWSPHGLYIAATSGRELAAIDPRGTIHWRLGAAADVHAPRWSPDGYRIAYRAGRLIRVVAGDGSGDHVVARAAAPIAPTWRPDRSHSLAWLTPGGVAVVGRVDGGGARVVASGLRGATWLGWAGRRELAAATPARLVALRIGAWRATSRRAWRVPAGARLVAAAVSPTGRRIAVLVRRSAVAQVRLLDAATLHPVRTIASLRAPAAAGLVWSPDGRHLVAALPTRGRWLLAPVDPGARPRLITGVGAGRPRGWVPSAPR